MVLRRGAAFGEAVNPWLLVAGTVVVVMALSVRALAPPPALPRDAPAERFSEGRARDVVVALTQDIGLRVNGTPGHARAAEYLANELRKLPGVEVELQEYAGTHVHQFIPRLPFVYRTTNVVARLPGKSAEAILLDTHYDTLIDSVGAADDAAGVACIVEALRALAREAPLDRTIVVNLNGAEEVGLLGAAAFLSHRWAKDVRAYLYLEALPAGRSVLIGAGPGNPWLAKAYARAVRAPLGNVVAQDLAQSGLLPFNGDFTPFHEAGLVGLDLAMVGDAWAVHTRLDRLDHLEQGGMQHLGDATLAATRELARAGTSLTPESQSAVFYDLLGLTMVAYSATTARALAALALVAFLLLLLRALYFHWVSPWNVLAAFGWTWLGVAAGLLGALLPAVMLKLVHGSPGWFARPALLVPAFAVPAASAMMAVQWRWRARALRKMVGDERRVALATQLGGLLFWAAWLLLATVAGAGTGYLALYWVAGGVAALLLSSLLPRLRVTSALVALVPGLVVTVEVAVLAIANMVPMTGLLPPAAPGDIMIPLLVGLATCLVGVVPLGLPYLEGGHGKAAILGAAVGLAGIVAVALLPPYTALRPKRVLGAHAASESRSALLLGAYGADGMRPLVGRIAGMSPVQAPWPKPNPFNPPFTHALPAPPPGIPAPNATVTASAYDAAVDERRVTVHLDSATPQLRLLLPAASLRAWSLTPTLPASPPLPGQYLVHLEGVPAAGVDIDLTLRGWQPVEIELRAIGGTPAGAPEVRALEAQLPDWVSLTTYDYRVARTRL